MTLPAENLGVNPRHEPFTDGGGPLRLSESIGEWLGTLDSEARAAVERGMAEA